MQQFTLGARVLFGKNSLQSLETIPGKKVLLVTDNVMVSMNVPERVNEILCRQGKECRVFSEVTPDPNLDVISSGVRSYQKCPPDAVIALGGGSVIDTAKGIIYSLYQMNKEYGTAFIKPYFVAIPTTSGTGSEVTSFTVVTMDSGKMALVDEWMVPDVALLDSSLTMSVPDKVTADTGIDVLCHALEAYVSTDATDFSDAMCEKAAELVFDHLIDAYIDGSNQSAREKMHYASCIAGIAFTNASLGIVHSLAHALGGLFHVPHGKANALLLPEVMRFNAQNDYAMQRYATMAKHLELPGTTSQKRCESLILAVETLRNMLNVPQFIQDVGIERTDWEEALFEMCNLALNDRCTATNPIQPTINEIRAIYQQAFSPASTTKG